MIGIFGLLLPFTFLSSANAIRERSTNVIMNRMVLPTCGVKAFLSDSLLKYLEKQVDFARNYREDHELLRESVSTANGIYLSQLVDYSKQGEQHYSETQLLLPYLTNSMECFTATCIPLKSGYPFLLYFC